MRQERVSEHKLSISGLPKLMICNGDIELIFHFNNVIGQQSKKEGGSSEMLQIFIIPA